MKAKPVVAGIGELLWDVFPEGKRLGGAPINFCYHCHQLGAKGVPVSAVGDDELGNEIRSALTAKGVPDTHVMTDPEHPTGTVRVSFQDGKPSYEICEGVAWDHIPPADDLKQRARNIEAVCFGSLAQRHNDSRTSIHAFLKASPAEALRIFDVNLRQTFFSQDVIAASLEQANVLKLSDEELPDLAQMFDLTGSVPEQLERLRRRFGLRLIAYTRGAEGSLLVTAHETDDHPGLACRALDTVGAGDSFTASLCMGMLGNLPLPKINHHANQVAAYVCSQAGATPTLPAELID